MKNTERVFVVLLTIIMLSCFGLPAFADTEMPPTDFVKETEDGKYVFVMLAPDLDRRAGKRPEIRNTYKASGLYSNDGSTTPLWTVYWFSFTVYPASDGKHIVRMGPWAQSTNDLALAFYKEGKELRSYSISDLVRDKNSLKHTVSHFFWRTDLKYNDKEGTVFLKTVDGLSYTFSVKTGEIVKDR